MLVYPTTIVKVSNKTLTIPSPQRTLRPQSHGTRRAMELDMEKLGPSTQAVHAGEATKGLSRASSPPIYPILAFLALLEGGLAALTAAEAR
jgi:hypothetical protein